MALENLAVELHAEVEELTPDQIVAELDRYIIAQKDAKKAVAIALRNRWRRMRVDEPMRDEITPKNIIMIGPTGVGKTEISRRLAKLVKAPFVKVEASKFTEVGYVGRDVESIIRDLAEAAYHIVREEEREKSSSKAQGLVEERLLDVLLPGSQTSVVSKQDGRGDSLKVTPGEDEILEDLKGVRSAAEDHSAEVVSEGKTREKLRKLLREGQLENRIVEFEVTKSVSTNMQILGPQGFAEIEGQIKEMFSNMVPRQRETRKLPVKDARRVILREVEGGLIDEEKVARHAIRRAEERGLVFIDEIDKICGGASPGKGPDVSREGVQRDLLPLVEGSTVSTKYGPLRTDHVLFIASGAFHVSKPSDLMPEFQGRFPIRVELKSLTPDDFVRILTEPENALTKQYEALMLTEGVKLTFGQDAIEEISTLTAEVNSRTENIGARRLHTLLERLLEDLSFSAHEQNGESVHIDRAYVEAKLANVVEDVDLARFIL
ncbi:MAG: ATP-dependent protease ATPase subunit HslU [Bdellovibrionales bacterium]|nr:ATP-dependent protease ATPase subunit HslU [Bdellovibrionales bacterium]